MEGRYYMPIAPFLAKNLYYVNRALMPFDLCIFQHVVGKCSATKSEKLRS